MILVPGTYRVSYYLVSFNLSILSIVLFSSPSGLFLHVCSHRLWIYIFLLSDLSYGPGYNSGSSVDGQVMLELEDKDTRLSDFSGYKLWMTPIPPGTSP
jgi:hypothetical protein